MGAYVLTTPDAQKVPVPLRRETSRRPKAPISSSVNVMMPEIKGGQLRLSKRSETAPKGEDPRIFVVNEYLRQLHEKGLGDSKARAIGIDLMDGVAHISFNPAFEQTYGTDDEGVILNGIAASLGQFPDIEKIQYEVEGKPMDSLGNVDLTEPQPVIRPGAPLTEGGPAAP